MSGLNHHALDLPKSKETEKLNRCDLEVWDDAPAVDQPSHVTLYIDSDENSVGSFRHVDLLPNEARALAALLINAADWQDRRKVK